MASAGSPGVWLQLETLCWRKENLGRVRATARHRTPFPTMEEMGLVELRTAKQQWRGAGGDTWSSAQ